MRTLKAIPITIAIIAAKLVWGAFVVVTGLWICAKLFDLFFWIL